MSWNGGLSIGASFAEIWVSDDPKSHSNQVWTRRWLLSRQSVADGLRAFFNEHPEIQPQDLRLQVATELARWVVERRVGSPVAWIGTSELEELVLLSPSSSQRLKAFSPRPEGLLSREVLFGVNERINADGQVQRPLQNEELEFLASKLKLIKIQDLGIGFLHSGINPAHELQARDYFQRLDFSVQISSGFSPMTSSEIGRWQLAILDAYVMRDLRQQKAEIQTFADGLGINVQFSAVGSEFLSQLAGLQALEKAARVENAWTDATLFHCGFENFWFLQPGESGSDFSTDFGTFRVDSLRMFRPSIQPTQIIEKGTWLLPELGHKQSGFEPGPLIFGKSTTPTLLDVLLNADSMSIDIVDFRTDPRFQSRLGELLLTMANDYLKNRAAEIELLPKSILDIAVDSIALQLLQFQPRKRIICSGPLSHVLGPHLKKRLTRQFEIIDSGYEFAMSWALALESAL